MGVGKSTQSAFVFRTWGGKRKNAGRKRTSERRRVAHRARGRLDGRTPVHVTLRVLPEIARLRRRDQYRAIRQALARTANKADFRLNAIVARKGAVFSDRYHARHLTSPIEVRRALCYVLNNWRRHREDWRSRWVTDPFSSAASFDGWAGEEIGRLSSGSGPPEDPPVAAATFWLLTTGWRRHGAIRCGEVPGGHN